MTLTSGTTHGTGGGTPILSSAFVPAELFRPCSALLAIASGYRASAYNTGGTTEHVFAHTPPYPPYVRSARKARAHEAWECVRASMFPRRYRTVPPHQLSGQMRAGTVTRLGTVSDKCPVFSAGVERPLLRCGAPGTRGQGNPAARRGNRRQAHRFAPGTVPLRQRKLEVNA